MLQQLHREDVAGLSVQQLCCVCCVCVWGGVVCACACACVCARVCVEARAGNGGTHNDGREHPTQHASPAAPRTCFLPARYLLIMRVVE